MAVVSPNHHSRHLDSQEEKIDFARTAPIEMPGYWAAADAVNARKPRVDETEKTVATVIEELQGRAYTEKDAALLQHTTALIKAASQAAIEAGSGN